MSRLYPGPDGARREAGGGAQETARAGRGRRHGAAVRRGPGRRLARALGDAWAAIVDSERPILPAAVIAVNLALTLYTGIVTLRDFPNSADEYAYLLSARLFAEGRLSVPSPAPAGFFSTTHVVNDGQYYGKYPPGWPALLTMGVLAGAPWVVNPLLGALTALGIYRIGRRYFSRRVANLALLVLLGSPFFIFNSASYFAHASGLFFVTLFIYGFFGALEEPSVRLNYLVMGCAGGMAFLIRPYTALAALGPFAVYLLLVAGKRQGWKRLGANLAAAAAPALLCLGVYLGYNYLQTGDPLKQPFSVYDPRDALGFSSPHTGLLERLYDNVLTRLFHLGMWLPLAPVFVVLWLADRRAGARRKGLALVLSFVSLLTAHYFYWGRGGNEYGPRYIYEALSALVVVMALVLSRTRRWVAVAALLLVIGGNLSALVDLTRQYGDQVRARMAVYDLVAGQQLTNALVFLKTGSGSMPASDLTRNGIHFDGPVLYVLNRGAHNAKLLERYPDRGAYVFEYDPRARAGHLWPLSSAPERR